MADLDLVVAKLRAIFELDSAQWESGIRKVQDDAKAWSKELDTIGRQATDIGKTFTAAFTVPIVAAFGGAAKAAIDFESSFAGVAKTVNATKPELEAMSEEIRQMALEIPIGVNELNRLAEAAGAMGIPTEQIVEFTRVMGMVGATTNLSADQATESITQIQNIFGSAGKETQNFASALVALGNGMSDVAGVGGATEQQIVEMAQQIASAGNAIGLTQAEVLGFASALASVGMNAEAGGTAIARTFQDIQRAVSEGGLALQNFAAVAGMAGQDFAQLFRADAAEAVVRFAEGLGKIRGEGGDLIATLDALEITERRQTDALTRLSGAGEILRESLRISGEEWIKNNALINEFAIRAGTTESQLKLLWARVYDLGITLGADLLQAFQKLLPAIESFLTSVASAVKWFSELPESVQTATFAMAAFVAAVGPLLLILGQIASAIGTITAAFTAKGLATKALIPLIEGLGTAISGLGSILGPVGLLATGFVVTMGKLDDALEQSRQSMEPVQRTLFEGGEAFKTAAKHADDFNVVTDESKRVVGLTDEGLKNLFATVKQSSAATEESTEKTKAATSAATLLSEEQRKAAEAAKKQAEETRSLIAELNAMERASVKVPDLGELEISLLDAALAAGKLHQELVNLENSSKGLSVPFLTLHEELVFMEGAFRGTIPALEDMGNAGARELGNLNRALDDGKKAAAESKQAIDHLSGSFQQMAQIVGGDAGLLISNIGQIATNLLKINDASPKVVSTVGSLVQGFVNIAASTESASTATNVLNGAIAGFSSGLAFGPYGAAVGAAAGAITGWVRASEAAREEAEQLREAGRDLGEEWADKMAQVFDDTAGSLDRMRAEMLETAGHTEDMAKTFVVLENALQDFGMGTLEVASLLAELRRAMREGPEAVEEVLNRINDLLEEHATITRNWAEGVTQFVDGFVQRVAGLTASMEDVTEATEEQAASFQRMGDFAVTAFTSVLEQTGSAIAAIRAIQEPLEQLIALEEEFGFTGSATYERLKDISGVIQANQSIFDSIEGLNQMMAGLDQATLLTQRDFISFAADASSLFQELIGNGVDANTAMALMQPTLQMLWEMQQRFGIEIDTSTQALLDQAQAAGIVGEEHRSINQQMLNALFQIEDAIRRLPEAFAAAAAGARGLSTDIEDAAYWAEYLSQFTTPGGGTPTGVAVPRGTPTLHQGGMVPEAHGGMVVGADERIIKAQVGEGILSKFATDAIGGSWAINALNTDPWGAVSRISSQMQPAMGASGYSAPVSGGQVTVGPITINIDAPGGDPRTVEDAARRGAMAVLEQIELGGKPMSKFRRVLAHAQA